MAPQKGKVTAHAARICPATLRSMPWVLQSPVPMMAEALECVVLAGIPKKEQAASTNEDAASEALPPTESKAVISQPTFLMIFAPPSRVPRVMTAAQMRTT